MRKPRALTEVQIAEIEDRLNRGWPIRRHHIEPLIAMARERNALLAEKQSAAGAGASTADALGGMTWTARP